MKILSFYILGAICKKKTFRGSNKAVYSPTEEGAEGLLYSVISAITISLILISLVLGIVCKWKKSINEAEESKLSSKTVCSDDQSTTERISIIDMDNDVVSMINNASSVERLSNVTETTNNPDAELNVDSPENEQSVLPERMRDWLENVASSTPFYFNQHDHHNLGPDSSHPLQPSLVLTPETQHVSISIPKEIYEETSEISQLADRLPPPHYNLDMDNDITEKMLESEINDNSDHPSFGTSYGNENRNDMSLTLPYEHDTQPVDDLPASIPLRDRLRQQTLAQRRDYSSPI